MRLIPADEENNTNPTIGYSAILVATVVLGVMTGNTYDERECLEFGVQSQHTCTSMISSAQAVYDPQKLSWNQSSNPDYIHLLYST